jgi:UDP-glucuronate 4-epimerase
MAYFSFTKAIVEARPIDIFNNGDMKRDFTYVDDIVEGTVRVLDKIPRANPRWSGDDPDPATSYAPYRLYNIGNNQPVELMHFIRLLEKYLGRETKKNHLPMQAGDVYATYADIDDLMTDVGFKPSTTLEVGLKRFVEWYQAYYRS